MQTIVRQQTLQSVLQIAALLAVAILVLAGCDGADPEVLPDATVADTGPIDAGPGSTVCGSAVCTAERFCRVQPTGPCEGADGGACGPGQESCEHGAVRGCTTAQARTCEALPVACAASASCACLIASNPCPGAIQADCRRPQGSGYIIECPF